MGLRPEKRMNMLQEEQIRIAIENYVRAFETLSPESVVACYGPSCLFIRPERVTAAADRESQLKIAEYLIEHAKASDYHRTEFEGLDVTIRGDRLAVATAEFIRYDSGQKEIGRFGAAYTLHKNDDGRWLIAVAMAYPPSEK